MALRAVGDNDPVKAACDVIQVCPICTGHMEVVYSRLHQKVCVCVDCHTSITVPQSAWNIKKDKGR